MSAIAQLFKRDQSPAMRGSERIREELNALPHPQRHSDMLHAAGQRRAQLASLSGQELQDASVEVAALDADAAEYRSKHDRVFQQCAALTAELGQVQQAERQALIDDRMRFHTVEAADCGRLTRQADAAAKELFAQQIATHLLAKSWRIDVAWTFGFPPAAIEQRAREIVAELQA